MSAQEAMKLGQSRPSSASSTHPDQACTHSQAREEAEADDRTLLHRSPSIQRRSSQPYPTLQEAFEAQKEDLTANRNRTGSDRFTSKIDDVQDELKKSTYGLVQLSDFKETREKIEEQARKEAAGAVQIK